MTIAEAAQTALVATEDGATGLFIYGAALGFLMGSLFGWWIATTDRKQ